MTELACPKCKGTGGVQIKANCTLDLIEDWNGIAIDSIVSSEATDKRNYTCLDCGARFLERTVLRLRATAQSNAHAAETGK